MGEVAIARERTIGLRAQNAMGKAVLGTTTAGKTESGYTPKMLRNILSREKETRNDEDETMSIFSPDGDLLRSRSGKGNAVTIRRSDVPQDAILTHNHPMSLGKTGTEAIGHSFTYDDIKLAISSNAKEIRAVTPTYTYSLKRPAGGWGIKTAAFTKEYWKDFNDRLDREVYPYTDKRNNDTAWTRADVVHFHAVIRDMAKRHGWEYSKKRG